MSLNGKREAGGRSGNESKKKDTSLAQLRKPWSKPADFPTRPSFAEFLSQDARVPTGRGLYGDYSFQGREALQAIVAVIDKIFTGKLADAEVSLAGGAQFGKTILELNLAAYCTSQQFRNFGLYLPDDDLVEGIVDSKFRPDVVDQIGWFANAVQVGKALNKSGRAVNRKGAFLVTDGQRKAVGMIRGLGKVPTTFSMDVAAMDELDDIEPKMMKFVRGRLAASDLRFVLKIGTQRVHGRGMNKAWKDGSQGVFVFQCPNCGRLHNAEEEFPQIVRLRMAPGSAAVSAASRSVPGAGETPALPGVAPLNAARTAQRAVPTCVGDDVRSLHIKENQRLVTSSPTSLQLTWAGDFRLPGSDQIIAVHSPANEYFLGCVECGGELDRSRPIEQHRVPELIAQRKWSFRISQLAIGAIDLSQIVARFQSAIADGEEMIVFRCDVLGLPQSTTQALTPAVLDRARSIELFDMAPRVNAGRNGYGGLDMGDRCWLFAREVASPGSAGVSPALGIGRLAAETAALPGTGPSHGQDARATKRLLSAERYSAGDVVSRAVARFHALGLSALFIDERPLVNEARTIALALNGLQNLTTWPKIPNEREAYVTLPGGLTWDGKNARWLGLKCAVVRFTKNKLGAGIEQGIVFFEESGQTKFVPMISCNRFESIDRVVREFLTPNEGVIDVVNGKVRETPAMLLPRRGIVAQASCLHNSGERLTGKMPVPLSPGHPPILDIVDAHLITGSEREKEETGALGDYVDGCENHFLLADAYSKLAEIVCEGNKPPRVAFSKVGPTAITALPRNIFGTGEVKPIDGILL